MRFGANVWLICVLLASSAGANSYSNSSGAVEDQVDYQLQPIVVTATRTPHAFWESDANVDVLTGAEIEQSSALHLGDALKLLPSVNIGQYGGLGQNVSLGIRGSTAGQVLIMVDGVPVNDPQLGGLDLNLISLDNVDRIEVIRGSASSLYGADALGGVVNVITRSSVCDTPLSDISYQQGDHGLEKIGGRFSGRLGQHLGLNLMASSTKSDGFRDNSDFQGRHLASRLNYALEDWGQLSYSTQIYEGELGVPGMDIMPTSMARQKDRIWNQTIAFQASPAQGNDMGLILYRNYNRQEYLDPEWFAEAQHRRWVYGVEIQHSFSSGHIHQLTVGGELQNRRLDSSENGRQEMDRGAVFAQDEMNLRENVRLRLAGRYDYHENFENQFNPDVTLTWLAADRVSVFTSLRWSYRAPTFNDLFWPESEYDYDFDGQPDYRESGNAHIKPEKAVTFQVGARAYRRGIGGNICVFRREIKDLIQWDDVDKGYFYGYWMPVNKSEAIVQGFEGQATAWPMNRLETALAYTLLEAKDTLLDRRLTYQPEHRLCGHLQYGVVLIKSQLEITGRLEFEYLSQRCADSWSGKELPSNTVIDGRVTGRVLDRFQIYLVGKNLRDKKYLLRVGYPLPGRTFFGGISWEFWD
jgi:outer membrane cobalamin receptor